MSAVPEMYWLFGQQLTLVHVSEEYTLTAVICPAGVTGPPPHLHRGCETLFYPLEGELFVMLEGSWKGLQPGQTAVAKAGMLHTFNNPGDRSIRFLMIHRPGGIEHFFRKHGVPLASPGAAGESMNPERVGGIIQDAAAFGMEFPES